MKKILAALAVAAAAMHQHAGAQDFEGLGDLIRNAKSATGRPSGTAIAVIKDGKVIHEAYYGFADIQARKPVTRDTVFYIASSTKPFFALSVLLKEGQGKLGTGMPLQRMFSDVGFTGFDAGRVTIKNLLVHTSGIENDALSWATAFTGIHDAQSRHALVAASRPGGEAGFNQFHYTNVGYNILSVWLDRTFCRPWQQQLADDIFTPLGMVRTSALISEADDKRWVLAQPYSVHNPDRDAPLRAKKTDGTMQAAGGMVSTAPDLSRFLIAQLDHGRYGGRQIFPREVIEKSHAVEAVTRSRYHDFERTGYAWGWYAGPYKGHRMLHHFGGFMGYHAHLSFIPERNIGLVVLNNEEHLGPAFTTIVADYVYSVLLNEADVRKRVGARFDAFIGKANSAAAQSHSGRPVLDNLSLDLDAYAGTYSNEILGTVSIRRVDRQLEIVWGDLIGHAAAAPTKDHILFEYSPKRNAGIAFVVEDGRVSALKSKGMVFSRR